MLVYASIACDASPHSRQCQLQGQRAEPVFILHPKCYAQGVYTSHELLLYCGILRATGLKILVSDANIASQVVADRSCGISVSAGPPIRSKEQTHK